ncbi:MAG: DUF3987 domain-containing protein [Prevotellaceae bacterium]|nr:DUF3987 domain-containing protein [Prevotellaceae bacterium]
MEHSLLFESAEAVELSTTEQESAKDGMTVKFVTQVDAKNADYTSQGEAIKTLERTAVSSAPSEEGTKSGNFVPNFVPSQMDERSVENLDEVAADTDANYTPAFSADILEAMPKVFKKLIDLYGYNEPYASTMMALGQIATVSAVLPNVCANIDRKRYYPNLGLFVAGAPASGKGAIQNCRGLIEQIDEQIYEEYLDAKASGEQNAPMRSLIFPGNSTNAAFIDMLEQNGGKGLMFESETKVLTSMLRNSEYGLNRETLLQLLEHEMVSIARVKDRTLIRIQEPQLSMVLTGVEGDVLDFLGKDGNGSGLVSRLLFFMLKPKERVYHPWVDDDNDDMSLDELLQEETAKITELHAVLSSRETPLKVKFSKGEKDLMNDWVETMLENEILTYYLGEEFSSVILRMKTNICRVAMVIALMRYVDKDDIACLGVQSSVAVSQEDFELAMAIGEVLFKHAQYVFASNCNTADRERIEKNKKERDELLANIEVPMAEKLIINLRGLHDNGLFTCEEFKTAAVKAGYKKGRYLDRLFRNRLGSGKLVLESEAQGLYSVAAGVVK